MKQLDWTKDGALASNLSKLFLREVMNNFRGYTSSDRPARVQFGITGTGIQPNYQITYFPGDPVREKTLAFRGSTHRPYRETEVFSEQKVSDYFTFDQVESARNG